MMIHDGDPQSFLRHFHVEQRHMVLALLVLSTNYREQVAIQDMLERIPQLDQILGENIGLYLFGPKIHNILINVGPRGRVTTMPGEQIIASSKHSDKSTAAKDFFENITSDNFAHYDFEWMRDQIARHTLKIVPDFCRVFGLSPDSLPVVCAIVRGSDQVITAEIRSEAVLDRLIEAARLLDREITAIRTRISFAVGGVDELSRQLRETELEVQRSLKIREEFRRMTASLERKYGVVVWPQLVGLINGNELTTETFDQTLNQASIHAQKPGLTSDSRSLGLRSRISRLTTAEQNIQEFANSRDWPRLLEDQRLVLQNLDQFNEGVVRAFHESGISVRTYGDGWIKKAIQFAGLAAKAAGIAKNIHGLP